jgi:hypothetical protein
MPDDHNFLPEVGERDAAPVRRERRRVVLATARRVTYAVSRAHSRHGDIARVRLDDVLETMPSSSAGQARARAGEPRQQRIAMGMFDTVVCRYPLPHHQGVEFQSKDLAAVALGERFVSGLLDEYEIAADGRLRRHGHEREWTADSEEFLGGHVRSAKDWWGYEDPIYRFYHHSFKVYALQEQTSRIVAAL